MALQHFSCKLTRHTPFHCDQHRNSQHSSRNPAQGTNRRRQLHTPVLTVGLDVPVRPVGSSFHLLSSMGLLDPLAPLPFARPSSCSQVPGTVPPKCLCLFVALEPSVEQCMTSIFTKRSYLQSNGSSNRVSRSSTSDFNSSTSLVFPWMERAPKHHATDGARYAQPSFCQAPSMSSQVSIQALLELKPVLAFLSAKLPFLLRIGIRLGHHCEIDKVALTPR